MAALSGLITVTTAGIAVQGPVHAAGRRFAIKAHPDNTDTVWVGNDGAGDITSSNALPLNPGEGVVVGYTLDSLWFDADVSTEKLCWLLLE